jgi:hypothetical protein
MHRHDANYVGESAESMEILERLEQGQIDADEAVRLLASEENREESDIHTERLFPGSWGVWWLIPLGIGVGITFAGGALATLGGWWWLCAAPLLILGITLMTLAAAFNSSRWIHVRVNTGKKRRPRRIAISLPVPVEFSAWVLKTFGHRIRGLDQTGVDELLLALDTLDKGLKTEAPIHVEIDEGEHGERIEVYLG